MKKKHVINPVRDKILMIRFNEQEHEYLKHLADKHARGKVAVIIRYCFSELGELIEKELERRAREGK